MPVIIPKRKRRAVALRPLLGGEERAGDLPAIERQNRQQIDEAPENIDVEQVIECHIERKVLHADDLPTKQLPAGQIPRKVNAIPASQIPAMISAAKRNPAAGPASEMITSRCVLRYRRRCSPRTNTGS